MSLYESEMVHTMHPSRSPFPRHLFNARDTRDTNLTQLSQKVIRTLNIWSDNPILGKQISTG